MEKRTYRLDVLTDVFAVCRLDADAEVPSWVDGAFVSTTRTSDELSVVCAEDGVPENVTAERGWRCMRLAGTLDFSLVGVIAGLTGILADSKLSVFVVSTYNTDYLFVKELNRAIGALTEAGYAIQ